MVPFASEHGRRHPLRRPLTAAALLAASTLSGCALRSPAAPTGASSATVLEAREGLASYYGPGFHGKTMASGARFDMNAMVAAHPTYPFGTEVRVTNLKNGRSIRLTILDRGPAQQHQADGVIIDVSRGAAERLGFIRDGRVRVRVEVLGVGKPQGSRRLSKSAQSRAACCWACRSRCPAATRAGPLDTAGVIAAVSAVRTGTG